MSNMTNIKVIIKRISFCLIGIAMMMGGCKPTEKNYQSAYKAAQEKRARDEAHRRELQADLGVDQTALQSVDDESGTWTTLTDAATNEEVRVKSVRKRFHRDDKLDYVVAAVATMRMKGNAQALADDLKAEGFAEARVARSGENFVVIIGESKAAQNLASTILKFEKKFPDFTYMGQGEMLVYFTR